MRSSDTDYTGNIGPSPRMAEYRESNPVPWPMYSFETPAFCFWNGVANGFRRAGWTEDEIQGWLQSKLARWEMDGNDHEIEELGERFAKRIIAEQGTF